MSKVKENITSVGFAQTKLQRPMLTEPFVESVEQNFMYPTFQKTFFLLEKFLMYGAFLQNTNGTLEIVRWLPNF